MLIIKRLTKKLSQDNLRVLSVSQIFQDKFTINQLRKVSNLL